MRTKQKALFPEQTQQHKTTISNEADEMRTRRSVRMSGIRDFGRREGTPQIRQEEKTKC